MIIDGYDLSSLFKEVDGLISFGDDPRKHSLRHYIQRLSPALPCASFETHALYAPLNKSCEAAAAYLRSESLCTVGVSGSGIGGRGAKEPASECCVY